MRAVTDTLTRERVMSKTRFTRDRVIDYIAAGQQMDDDPEKGKRQRAQLCRWCHYAASRIAGQAFTDRNCGICNKDMQFSSTDTDVVCSDCATKHELCKHCGADRELRPKRSTFVDELAQESKPEEPPPRTQRAPLPAMVLLPRKQ
jgi:hypothetical protein